ncbi:hypothetical protein IH922_00305 [candidate division KSB1 bacterium]|nr:hypothetical protein [candidate division KSB1 bacterium]
MSLANNDPTEFKKLHDIYNDGIALVFTLIETRTIFFKKIKTKGQQLIAKRIF